MIIRRMPLAVALAATALGAAAVPALAAREQRRVVVASETVFRFVSPRGPILVHPGRVRLVLRNPSLIPHTINIRGGGLRHPIRGHDPDGVNDGRTTFVLAPRLPAGRYVYYCSLPGHEAMRGALVVR